MRAEYCDRRSQRGEMLKQRVSLGRNLAPNCEQGCNTGGMRLRSDLTTPHLSDRLVEQTLIEGILRVLVES